jgi:hypothetical protein
MGLIHQQKGPGGRGDGDAAPPICPNLRRLSKKLSVSFILNAVKEETGQCLLLLVQPSVSLLHEREMKRSNGKYRLWTRERN